MHSILPDSASLALLAVLAGRIAADNGGYFNMYMQGAPLVSERLDPLMSSGKISNHLHSVAGGNGFAPAMDFAQTQTSTCTTAPIKVDKSNYWMPAVFYKSPHNGSFIRVPENPGTRKIYYKYGTGKNTIDTEQSEFPKDFRMITGNAMLRSDDGSHGTSGDQMAWQCHQPNYVTVKGTGGSFPQGFTSCHDGFAANIRFPSCWNGQAFDPAKPSAHMAFPINKDGLAGCVAPFNVKRFPEIFIEYWLDVSMFNGDYGANDSPWVLANGDPTGYAFHADFMNGWEVGKLGAAMKTCTCGNGCGKEGLSASSCFGDDYGENDACTVKPVVDEPVDGPLPHLPGCNPIQAGPGAATIQTGCTYKLPTGFTDGAVVGTSTGGDETSGSDTEPTDTTSTSASGVSGSSVTSPTTMATSVSSAAMVNKEQTPTPAMPIATATSQQTSTPAAGSPSESGSSTSTATGSGSDSGSSSKKITASDGSSWSLLGCYTDQLNPVRSLGGNPEWWGEQITGSNCVDRCSQIGMSMSGTENGGQCFCGNSLVGSQKADLSDCDMPCKGDSTQTCGGGAKISVYKKLGGSHRRNHRHVARHFQVTS